MSETKRLRADGLADMFEEMGIAATREQIEQISEDFAYGMDMEREMSMYQHIGAPKEKCAKCVSLGDEIKGLRADIEVYKNGVKRRNPGAAHVYVEGGQVYYDLR